MKIKLDPGAHMPVRAYKNDGGLDLFSTVNTIVYPGDSAEINTGVHFEIPEGYVGLMKSRSGTMFRDDIITDGTIDSDYRGAVKVKLFNLGFKEFVVRKGERIAQLVLIKVITPELEVVGELEETERGSSGFGSTGR